MVSCAKLDRNALAARRPAQNRSSLSRRVIFIPTELLLLQFIHPNNFLDNDDISPII